MVVTVYIGMELLCYASQFQHSFTQYQSIVVPKETRIQTVRSLRQRTAP
jgi:hypothetical protein